MERQIQVRHLSAPPEIIILSDDDENESSSNEPPAPVGVREPGPSAVRKALKRFNPSPGTVIISDSDDDEDQDDIIILDPPSTVLQRPERLVPADADPQPGSSRPDTSIPLRPTVIVANFTAEGNGLVNTLTVESESETMEQNLDMNCPEVLRRLLVESETKLANEKQNSQFLLQKLAEAKDTIQYLSNELNAANADLQGCRNELRKKQKPSEKSNSYSELEVKYRKKEVIIEKLKKELTQERKNVGHLKAAKNRIAKHHAKDSPQKDAIAGPSRKALVAVKRKGYSDRDNSNKEAPKRKRERVAPPKEKVEPPSKKSKNGRVIVVGGKKREEVPYKRFRCRINPCGETFPSAEARKNHVESRHSVNEENINNTNDGFHCKVCERSFKSKRGLGIHSRVHKNKKKRPGTTTKRNALQ